MFVCMCLCTCICVYVCVCVCVCIYLHTNMNLGIYSSLYRVVKLCTLQYSVYTVIIISEVCLAYMYIRICSHYLGIMGSIFREVIHSLALFSHIYIYIYIYIGRLWLVLPSSTTTSVSR